MLPTSMRVTQLFIRMDAGGVKQQPLAIPGPAGTQQCFFCLPGCLPLCRACPSPSYPSPIPCHLLPPPPPTHTLTPHTHPHTPPHTHTHTPATPPRLDYPGIGPEHSFLKDVGRAEYYSITDAEALGGFTLLSK